MFRWWQGQLYQRVYDDTVLTEAWRKVRVGTPLAGVDGVTVPQFEARLFANLKALQEDLRHLRYYPQVVKRFAISKTDGTKRPLGLLTVRDRIVQRAVLQVIEPLFDAGFEECSHGFRKGRSPQTALSQVARLVDHGYSWIVDLDIAACFEQINTNRLFGFMKETLKDAELRRLLRAWLDIETVAVERTGLFKTEAARGLLQGGILSPLFANIYLDGFDKMALKLGLKLVRFADDIVICCHSQAEATWALKQAKKLLAKMDLELNPRKTIVMHAEKGIRFLGQQVFLKHRNMGRDAVVVTSLKPVEKPAPTSPEPLALPDKRPMQGGKRGNPPTL